MALPEGVEPSKELPRFKRFLKDESSRLKKLHRSGGLGREVCRARAAVMDEASRGVLLRGLLDEAIAAGSGRVPAEPPGAMGLSGAAPPVSMDLSSTKKKRRKKMNKHKLRKRRRKNRNKKRPA